MNRDRRFQTYVTPRLEAWIRDQARERRVSASIIICDCVFAAWQRTIEDDLPTPAIDPARQGVFATVALDALLSHHPDETLRERTIAAYHRRLEKLGMIARRAQRGEDEARP
ncbi:MAG: hypothetical protein ACO1OD_08470 [Croceibacterium sp.]